MQSTALQDAIDQLLALNEFGRHAEMEVRAAALLKSFPGVPVVRELLGMALAAQQRFAEALPHFKRAVRDEPDDPFFWDNLAFCQLQLQDIDAAEATLRQATARHPGSVSAWSMLADVLLSGGRLGDARSALDRVLALQPNDPGAHFVAGRIAAAQSRSADAERHFHVSLAHNPDVAAVHGELAKLLLRNGAMQAAEASFRRAVTLEPNVPDWRAGLCRALATMGLLDIAADEVRGLLDVLRAAGGAVSDHNIESFDVAAGILGAGSQLADAIDIYKATVRFRKEPLRAVNAHYAARRACDWDFASETEVIACGIADERADIDETVPWRLLSISGATPQLQLAAASRVGRHLAKVIAPVAGTRQGDRQRLRIGYFSGDFNNHAVTHLISGVIECHDRNRFEIVAYDFTKPVDDTYRLRIMRAFDRAVSIWDLPHGVAAQLLADDGADVIVDLTGWLHRARSRSDVLAARPAPVQIHWPGFTGTLGAPWIDYLIADEVLVPFGCEGDFAEKIIRMPDTMQGTDDKRPIGEALPRSAYGLPDDALVVCSFNEAYKITPEIFTVWLQILHAVPNSVLWLLLPGQEAVASLRQFAENRGIGINRIVFAPRLPVSEHLARITRADLALDCFPYGSHTTANDCMWAGVPMIALMGDTYASRVSASVLTAAGMGDLATRTIDEYRALALRLASNRDERAALRERLERMRGTAPLFDTRRYTRHLEAAFEAIVARHRQGLPPDHVNIAPIVPADVAR